MKIEKDNHDLVSYVINDILLIVNQDESAKGKLLDEYFNYNYEYKRLQKIVAISYDGKYIEDIKLISTGCTIGFTENKHYNIINLEEVLEKL